MTIRARLFRLIAASAISSSVASAFATPMIEPGITESKVVYQHGDFIEVACAIKKNSCHVALGIGGRELTFGAKELRGLEPDPHGITLFFGDARRFSFRTDVVCPGIKTGNDPQFRCRVDAAVVDGHVEEITLAHFEEQTVSSTTWPS